MIPLFSLLLEMTQSHYRECKRCTLKCILYAKMFRNQNKYNIIINSKCEYDKNLPIGRI